MVALNGIMAGGNGVKLAQAFSKTTYPKTGTVVEKALNNQANRLTGGIDTFGLEGAGITKLISYGKNTKLYKAGIQQVQITKLKDGSAKYQYFNNGKQIYEIDWSLGKNGNVVGSSESNSLTKIPFFQQCHTVQELKTRLSDSLAALMNVGKIFNK